MFVRVIGDWMDWLVVGSAAWHNQNGTNSAGTPERWILVHIFMQFISFDGAVLSAFFFVSVCDCSVSKNNIEHVILSSNVSYGLTPMRMSGLEDLGGAGHCLTCR